MVFQELISQDRVEPSLLLVIQALNSFQKQEAGFCPPLLNILFRCIRNRQDPISYPANFS